MTAELITKKVFAEESKGLLFKFITAAFFLAVFIALIFVDLGSFPFIRIVIAIFFGGAVASTCNEYDHLDTKRNQLAKLLTTNGDQTVIEITSNRSATIKGTISETIKMEMASKNAPVNLERVEAKPVELSLTSDELEVLLKAVEVKQLSPSSLTVVPLPEDKTELTPQIT